MPEMSDMGDFVATHKGLVIGGGLILVLVVAGKMMTNKSSPTGSVNGPLSSFGDPSHQGGMTAYVPTSTTFTTINQGAFSNDPALENIANSGNTTTTTSATSTTKTVQPPAIVGPPTRPPGPQPIPAPTNKRLIWDQGYSVSSGQTLSLIASIVTRNCRAQGMPTTMTVTWGDIYSQNQATVTSQAQAHGFKSDYWNWIFPGERLTVARWG